MTASPSGSGLKPAWANSHARRVGRYLLGRTLGKGGMGEVVEAWDAVLGRRVALKLLSHASAMAMLRFLNEAQLQARVDHPNVCRIFDVEVSGEVPFIAMQLVDGPTLMDAGLDPPLILQVMRTVCEAVHAAHRLNLIHRDLKPSNILLEANGRGGWTPYVCDFGLAKDLSAAEITQTHIGLGTPGFMAPEQMANGRHHQLPVGPAADIYTLGATLEVLLAGEPSSVAITPHQLPDPSAPPEPVASRSPAAALDPAVRMIIDRCMRIDPEERYPTAAAVAEDLRRYLDGEELLDGGWTRRRRLLGWVKRSPGLAAALACLVLLLGGTVAAGALGRRAAARQARLGERYAATIKDLQYLMRIERMLPPHDLRPAFLRVRERMATVEAALPRLTAAERGPGRFALAWGHLLLREPGAALREVRGAWEDGYRTPDVACALARARCEVYLEELPSARQAGAVALEALRQNYLRPAREDLAQAEGAELEPASLMRIELEVLEDHPAQALLLARKLGQDAPWLYEARLWEAAARYELGFQHQRSGRYAQADEAYLQGDRAAHEAQDLARSDEWALKVELNRRLAWVAMAEERGRLAPGDFEAVQGLVDRLLRLNPDWLPAIADQLTLLWRKGDYIQARGGDPEPVLQPGLALLARARSLPGQALGLHRDRSSLVRILAQRAYDQGMDPRPILREALDGAPDDEFTADLLLMEARYGADHDADPEPLLDRALRGLAHPSYDRPLDYGILELTGAVWMAKARWALYRRQPAGAALARAGEALAQALAMNPQSCDVLTERAQAAELAYRASGVRGEPDPALLHAALDFAGRARALRPEDPWVLRTCAKLECLASDWSLLHGQGADPWWSKCRRDLDAALAKAPDHPYVTLLEIRAGLNRIREARANHSDSSIYEQKVTQLLQAASRRSVAMDEVAILAEEYRRLGGLRPS